MNHKVFCKKYQKEMPGLSMPPIPGPKGKELQNKKSHTVHFGTILEVTKIIDEVVLTIYYKDHSFTGEERVHSSVLASQGFLPASFNFLLKNAVTN